MTPSNAAPASVRLRHAREPFRRVVRRGLLLVAFGVLAAGAARGAEAWPRKSSASGDLPAPNEGTEQTCCIVLDIDRDGVEDFVVGERTRAPSLVGFRRAAGSWERLVIDEGRLAPEAGGDSADVDRDGDLDIVLGQDSSGSQMWWWENPCPEFGKPWKRRLVKDGGGRKHHDQSFGDWDGDGQLELVSWNQGAKALLLFEIPEDARSAELWPSTVVYSWTSGEELEGFPSGPIDIDGDGTADIVGGGRWFRHAGDGRFEEHAIDETMRFTQCAAGQLVKGGRPEVVFSPGDADGEARWYEWDGKRWVPHALAAVVHGHTCEIRDLDGDGNLDILIGEMGKPGAGEKARVIVWSGDGRGGFRESVISTGLGIHEGKIADVDGDGDADVVHKPYSHNTPRIDILLNPRRP